MNARTPSGVVITATRPDGTTENVTEGVQALYDLVVGSMDFGSKFLTVEDAVPVALISRFCGFERAEEIDRYLADVDVDALIMDALGRAYQAKGGALTPEERREVTGRFERAPRRRAR